MADRIAKPAQVFIFVNPTAGGNRAAVYLDDLGPCPIQIRNTGLEADLWIYNIREGDSGKKEGFLQVKELSDGIKDAAEMVRVMVAGGDGTVMWALSELIKTNVDMANVAVGHIPFGTANDFSRTTGWGPTARANLIGENKEFLFQDVRRWVYAEVKDFDVWEVDIVTAPEGQFLFVHNGKKDLTENDKVQHGLIELPEGGMRMRKPMVNYFSFGFSERAGVGFEKMRTRNRLLNNVRYGWEGTKKWLFRRPPSVSDVLEELNIGLHKGSSEASMAGSASATKMVDMPTHCEAQAFPSDSIVKVVGKSGEDEVDWRDLKEAQPPAEAQQPEPEAEAPGPQEGEASMAEPASQVTLRSDRSSITLDTSAEGMPRFRWNSADLLFINIPSFAGGADPWAWSSRLAVEGHGATSEELLCCEQDFGDGKLELLSYSSGLSIGLDAVNSKARVPGRGQGCRIASDHGPFTAQFKPPHMAKYKSPDGRVYFQIDGEFFVATLPKTAVVRHFQTVRVLTCDMSPAGGRCC